ncbi:MAG: hypothetical protein R6X29_09245 [Acidimicrobiia bacterium]
MAHPITWGDRIRYRFDLLLSRGSAATIGWVVALAVVLAIVGGLVFWAIGVDFGERRGPVEAFWQAFLIVIGRGGIVDGGWPDRLATFTFVFAGVFLTGSLIGVLVAAVSKRLDALRRGRGRVLERGHTVILGWSPRLMPVIDELLAEERRSGRVSVVVLADRDKQAMEDDFRATHRGSDRNRVLFRRGDPSSPSDLEMVSVDRAGAVIVLSEGSFVDAVAVRRSLAAHAVEPEGTHVIVEMTNPRVARSLAASTSGTVVPITVDTVVADMLAQAIRTRGMARVFDELLSFGGSELYVCEPGAAAHRRFAEVACGADGLVVLGMLSPNGTVALLPPPDTVVEPGDRLVVLAKSRPAEIRAIAAAGDSVSPQPGSRPPRAVVMIGWSEVGSLVLDRLASYLPPGSRIEILADVSLLAHGMPAWAWPLNGSFVHTKHDPNDILGAIERLGAAAVAVLGYSDGMSEAEADALTLLTLLTLDRARLEARIPEARIIGHLYDNRLRTLARASGHDDFVVTDALTSRMLVHTSRHGRLGSIYTELFDPQGPIVDAVRAPTGRLSYGAVAAGIVAEGMVPLGTIQGQRVSLNPSRSEVLSFADDDRIVVVRRLEREAEAPPA